jgi:uncharacterized membrane protein YphA (DoxX/SURF4 family)
MTSPYRGKEFAMRNVLRWALAALVVAHGLIHLLGVAKGLGGVNVEQLKEPIGAVAGVAWLVAAVVVVAAAALLAIQARLWWAAMTVAAVVSQAVIMTSWSDANLGTVVNVIMVVAASYGYYTTRGRAPVPRNDATPRLR